MPFPAFPQTTPSDTAFFGWIGSASETAQRSAWLSTQSDHQRAKLARRLVRSAIRLLRPLSSVVKYFIHGKSTAGPPPPGTFRPLIA